VQFPKINKFIGILKKLSDLNIIKIVGYNVESRSRAIVKILAQGSKLSFFLFNVFINDLILRTETTKGNIGIK
jgi:hypothetical protein